MKILEETRMRIPDKLAIASREDFDSLNVGDLVKVKPYLGEKSNWATYEGIINGKEAFMRQDQVKPHQIISYRGGKNQLLVVNNSLWIPEHAREIKIYTPNDLGYGYKMGLLMAGGLWKSPGRITWERE